MVHEVVVVGGGIGGLTVAALLASRGVDVCVLERQPQIGGCIANFEKFGNTFEPTMGLYACFGPGDLHERIFSELPVELPETRLLTRPYIARLSDESEIAFSPDAAQNEETLRACFTECAEAAVGFYRNVRTVDERLRKAFQRVPDLLTASHARQVYAFLPNVSLASQFANLKKRTLFEELEGTSRRFREFIELQLYPFSQLPPEECAYVPSCAVLGAAENGLFAIRGGAAAVAERLAESIRRSGGKIRLGSPVLRISFDESGQPTGVDLLTGENIPASKAIISNMTLWDTYGKLIGMQRTPVELRKKLLTLVTPGAYLVFASMDQNAAERLPADNLLIATEPSGGSESLVDVSRFAFSAAPVWDARAPEGKRAVTVTFSTDVDQWFTYQADAEEQTRKDEEALTQAWEALHRRIPELGGDIEVIETATPFTYYETTRRKLGMVGGLGLSVNFLNSARFSHRANVPNIFIVGDSCFPAAGLISAAQSALTIANEITS